MLVIDFVKKKCCRRNFNVYKFVGLDCKAKCIKIRIYELEKHANMHISNQIPSACRIHT